VRLFLRLSTFMLLQRDGQSSRTPCITRDKNGGSEGFEPSTIALKDLFIYFLHFKNNALHPARFSNKGTQSPTNWTQIFHYCTLLGT